MTPLAQRIVRELTLPLKRRTFDDDANLLSQMGDIHCFEVTAIAELAFSMAEQIYVYGTDARATFLPAAKTWIEWDLNIMGHHDWIRGREGVLLEERDGTAKVIATARYQDNEVFFSEPGGVRMDDGFFTSPTSVDLNYNPKLFLATPEVDDCFRPEVLLAYLAMINTPRIVGRRQHMPHRGLERELVRAQALVGKFPLHAWTEIKLEVAPPKDMSGNASVEAHLTGEKALHFCRSHLRVRRGRLEVVRAHWRGNPALGIKRSRYRLCA